MQDTRSALDEVEEHEPIQSVDENTLGESPKNTTRHPVVDRLMTVHPALKYLGFSLLMAYQNPKGSAGTQLLPESQLDRFMICMSMGYPSHDAEVDIAKGKSLKADEYTIKPVMNAQGLVEMQGEVEQVFIHDSIYSYIVDLVDATRTSPYIELGVSPRGTIACVRMAKAYAYLSGRSYVIPSDVVSVFADVTKHRIVLNTKARVSHVSELSVIDEILKAVKQPTTYVKKAGNRD